MSVALPMYTDALGKHKLCGQDYSVGDPYFVLLYTAFWFIAFFGALIIIAKLLNPKFPLHSTVGFWMRCFIGLLNSLNGIFVVFASLPSRTPAFLQPLLSTVVIPFTVIFRFIILRKKVSVPRLICCLAVVVGLIISAEPVIFNIDGGNEGGSTEKSSSAKKAIWSAVFAFGFVPLAISNVVQEMTVKTTKEGDRDEKKAKDDVNTLVFMLWIQIWTFIFLGIAFWIDFIPEFGMYSHPDEFGDMMSDGMKCMFGAGPSPSKIANCTMMPDNPLYNPDPHCTMPNGRCWLFIVFYCLANLFSLMLIKYADGAIYLVIVNALVNPISGVFWTLFALRGRDSKFYWAPTFNAATIYVLAGLAMMVPAVVIYNMLGRKEKQAQREPSGERGGVN